MNKKLLLVIGGGILILAILQISVAQKRVISYGVDTYAAHFPLYGSKTFSQTITTKNTTEGIGTILVDLRGSHNLTDVQVEVRDEKTKEILISHIVPKESIRDDEFAYTMFEHTPLPSNQEVRITFFAPEATNQNPIGIRLDSNKNTAALALAERVSLARSISTVIQNRGNNWEHVLIALCSSLLVACAAFLPYSKKSWFIILGVLMVVALGIRTLIIPTFGGVSGGDAYNYLSISNAISEGKNPFENTKRLPGYPLILTPFYASGLFDDQHVMRHTQAIASIIGIIFLAGIARTLQLSWPVALTASAILAFQKDYFFTSTRPEPYALYTMFLLASVFFFFRSYINKKIWMYIVFGLCLGYGAMVRQEGFMFAALLGICSLIYECFSGKSLKRFLWMYLPALCLVAPFFIHNMVAYGNPLYTEYLEGERLQIVDSFLAFQDSLGATWGVIGSMWKPSWDTLERVELTNPLFIASLLILWAWYVYLKYFKHTSHAKWTLVCAVLFWIIVLLSSVYTKTQFVTIFPTISAAWILGSIPLFLMETKWRGLVVIIVLISQIGIATWFHPFPKHYQQSYPFIVLILATAFLAQVPSDKKILTAATLASATLPFFIIAVFLGEKVTPMVDKYNENIALDSVIYRAARMVRNFPGPIGFDQAYLPARLYFDPDAKYFPDEDKPSPEMEEEWLQKNHLKTMVVTNGNNVFKTIPANWKHVKNFKAVGRDDKLFVAAIYLIP